MKARWGLGFVACLLFGALSLASSETRAQTQCQVTCELFNPGCNVVDCAPPQLPGLCVGTSGADCIIGTANPETIFGLGGNDCICGGDGDDTLNGDSPLPSPDDGNDILIGEAGNDTLNGAAGNDALFGLAGADTLNGDEGDDQLSGGTENDQLFGGDGADTLSGDGGDDTVNGEGGDDTLNGNAGDDTINGGDGNDDALGGPGMDTISGGNGDDTLSGGDDADRIDGNAGDDTLNGDGGDDRLDGGADQTPSGLLDGGTGTDNCGNFATGPPVGAVNCELFTHATLDSFAAFDDGSSVVLRWVTSSETGTVGFYLYRERDGEWESLHEGILPGLLDAPQGGIYDFRYETGDRNEPQRYLLVEIDAYGGESTHGPFEVTADSHGESLLAGDVIYGREAHATHAIGPTLKAAHSEKQRAGEPVALYFGVEQTGLYAVSAAEIAMRFGLDEAGVRNRIQSGELSLTEEGEPVAWSASPDGSELRFFGLVRKDLYTTERIYRLTLENGAIMAEQSAAPDAIAGGLTFEGKLHLEADEIPGVLVARDPDVDYWFWQLISAAPTMPQSAVVTFDLASVAGDGEIRIDLHGVLDEPHSVAVKLNGTLIGTTQFEGVVPHQATFPVPESVLNEGENTLSIEPTVASDSALYLNFADLAYTRAYATSTGSLLFDANQDASVEVTGLTGNGIEVFDVTNSRQPVKLTDTVASATGLQLATDAEREYFALTAEEVRAPSSIWNDVPSDLRNRANAAGHLVIAPAQLLEKAQELVDYRDGDELESMLVELQDIYDEFAFGTPDPNAIRAFLRYTHENWATAPEFVVLVGKGSFDYRDVQGKGGNLFPPIMALTKGGIFSSDNKYADILGDDGVPDVSIGRLPVASASDLDAVVQQIISYEASIDSLRNDVTFLADANDPGANFGAWADATSEGLPADWDVAAVYRSELGDLESTRALLFDELRKGPRVLGYLGHAGITRLGKVEALLSIEDLETIAMDGHQPVFAAMSCVSSRFAVPGLVSLGEAMLVDDEGAIAVWGPSGLSLNEQASMLGNELLAALSSDAESRLGPMIASSYSVLADSEHARDMMAIYHLFGDPALRVAKGSDVPGTGGPGGSAGTDGSGSGLAGSGTDGCSVGWSGHQANGVTLLLLGVLALAWRRRPHQRQARPQA